MKIGLYFGSFNPIHVGHLIIASHVADNTDLKQLWLVVTPQNPLKPSPGLLNEYHRLHLTRLAVEGDDRFFVSDVEFKLPRPSYTIDTLTYLAEKYPQHEFSIVMGSDSYNNLPRWKNHSLLLKKYDFHIYKRPGFDVDLSYGGRITILNAPLLDISATAIRGLIKKRKSIRYLLPNKVADEILLNRYYH